MVQSWKPRCAVARRALGPIPLPVPIAALSLVLIGCAGSPRPAPASGPAAAPAPATLSSTNRPVGWYLEPWSPVITVAEFPLDGGGALDIVSNGLRILRDHEGRATVSGERLLHEVAAATRFTDGTFVAIDLQGRTVRFQEPLGEAADGPAAVSKEFQAVQAGRSAFVGLTKAGELLRSLDRGATWAACSFSNVPGVTKAFAMARDGRGVVVRVPQRFFVTEDDGATWSSLASPPHGDALAFARVNARDEIVFGDESGSFDAHARLRFDPARFETVGDDEKDAAGVPAFAPPRLPTLGSEQDSSQESRRFVSGRRAYRATFADDGISVSTTTLDEATGDSGVMGETVWKGDFARLSPTMTAGERGVEASRPALAARESRVAIAFYLKRKEGQQRDSRLVLLESTDGGKSFASVPMPDAFAANSPHASLDEQMLAAPGGLHLFLLAEGGVLVSERNETTGDSGADAGDLLLVAPNGATTRVADEAPVAFDETPMGRIVGLSGRPVKGPRNFLTSMFAEAGLIASDDRGRTFRSVPLPTMTLPGGSRSPLYFGSQRREGEDDARLGHDPEGRPVVAALVAFSSLDIDAQRAPEVAVVRVVLEGDVARPTEIPTDQRAPLGRIVLDGAHGIFEVKDEAFETADGGKTFFRARVPVPIGCHEGACSFGSSLRVGWSHEGRGPIELEKLAFYASNIQTDKENAFPTKRARAAAVVACSPASPWKTLGEGRLDADGAFRGRALEWMGLVTHADNRIDGLILSGHGGTLHPERVPLLPAHDGDVSGTATASGPSGFVVSRDVYRARPQPDVRTPAKPGARYEAFSYNGKPVSPSIQVAWFDGGTHGVRVASLAEHMRRESMALLEDGVLFKTASQVWRVFRNGEIRVVPNPPTWIEGAKGWADDFLVAREAQAVRRTAFESPPVLVHGRATELTAWQMGREGQFGPFDPPHLLLWTDRKKLVLGSLDIPKEGPAQLFTVDARGRGNEPAEVGAIPLDQVLGPVPLACERDNDWPFLFAVRPRDEIDVRVEGAPEDQTVEEARDILVRASAEGHACASDITTRGRFFIWVHLMEAGYSVMFRNKTAPAGPGADAAKKTAEVEWRLLTCTAPKP